MKKVWKWINYNRYVTIGPIVAIVIWITACGMTATTESPTRPGRFVNALELQTEFELWQLDQEKMALLFKAAGENIEQQQKAWSELESLMITLASGGVADLPGLLKLLAGGTLIGAIGDNIRKRGLISGLKKNG